jgi:hypothetical protein
VSAELAEAHVTAQARLRELGAGMIANAWRGMPAYHESDLDLWLTTAVPIVLAAQRQAVSLTEAFLARSLGRQPFGVPPAGLIGDALRGTSPETVYRRPFVTVWTALGAGKELEAAIEEGLTRATAAAATDVQLAMRSTLREVGQVDEAILGYQRVPDAAACDFCRLVAGQRYTTDELMPIHTHCGCGVDVITAANRGDFSGRRENDLNVTDGDLTVAVREHGELGPVLVDAAHDFTAELDI